MTAPAPSPAPNSTPPMGPRGSEVWVIVIILAAAIAMVGGAMLIYP